MLTRLDLQGRVTRLLDEAGQTATETRVQDMLNDALVARLNEVRQSFLLWPKVETITTVAGTQSYILHPLCAQLHSIYNQTQDTDLIEVPERNLLTAPEDDLHFHLIQTSPVKVQPTAAGVLTIVSDNGSDSTAAKAITIRGVSATGEEVIEAITPSGITPVSSSASFSPPILNVSKGASWVGTLTLTDALGNTLLSLGPTEYGKQYPQIELLADPGAGQTIEYRFYRSPRLMLGDYDIPELPFPHSMLLVWDALVLILPYAKEMVDAGTLAVWQAQRSAHELSFRETYLTGRTLGARARYVHMVGDED